MRSAGVLLHISSLPGPYGVGTFGEEAYRLVDFLARAGQKIWQILPLCPIGKGDSPYATVSTFAMNDLLIDGRLLANEGLLPQGDAEPISQNTSSADYVAARRHTEKLTQIAYTKFCEMTHGKEEYEEFCLKNSWWLEDYSLFMALRNHFEGASWTRWDHWAKYRDEDELKVFQVAHSTVIDYYRFVQYIAQKQWNALKSYANGRGIRILGDLPIYVSHDSADVWAHPQLFCLDSEFHPTEVAGCPPDYFSPTGQLWENPLYNWEEMSKDGYAWWISRLRRMGELLDAIRLDHFRGFESFYSIPYGHETAQYGRWVKGPGMRLFQKVREQVNIDIIAEDLGSITPEVKSLLNETGYPGMKVLQFAFSACGGSDYLPHNHVENCVLYTGTHDNDTLMGFIEKMCPEDRAFLKTYLAAGEQGDLADALIRCAYRSVAKTVILPLQDYLRLDSEYRMNIPSTPEGNWRYRVDGEMLTDSLADNIRSLTQYYQR